MIKVCNPMKAKKTILIINQTAGSPYHGMVYRNYYLAKEWVKHGHKVIIISASYFHNFHTLPKTDGFFTQEIIEGIEYWWVKMPHYSQSKSFGRLLALFIFPLKLFFFPLHKIAKPDAIIVSGPPHISILPAWIWARLKSAKLIFEVRDIWPLTIQKLGNVSPWHPLIVVLTFFEKFAYRFSDRVVSVLAFAWIHFESKGMKKEKFAHIPNGIDLEILGLHESEAGKKVAEISKDRFVVIYTGSIGIANNLDLLLDAAELLKEENIEFVLIGDGPFKLKLEEKYAGNSKVHFFSSVSKKYIPFILKQAHVGFVGAHKSDLYKFGVSPNKVYDYMAAGLPILMSIDTEDDIVTAANAGLTLKSGTPDELAKGIRHLSKLTRKELDELGENGKRYLEKKHTYSVLAQRYLDVIK